MENFFGLSVEELGRELAKGDSRAFRVGQVLRWVYRIGIDDFSQMTDLPVGLREHMGAWLTLNPMKTEDTRVAGDGTVKFLYALEDGAGIESVLIPDDGHFTLCISTQTGCSMGCLFCETGRAGGGRNLTSGEILSQVVYGFRYLGERLRLRNLVFMGMGEPMKNLGALLPALEMILDGRVLDFSPRRVTVSTCGWVPGIDALGRAGLDVNLAVSLNAADDVTRSRLMPVNRTYPIGQVLDAVRRFPLKKGRRVTFEYVLIDGVNDRPRDARGLAALLAGIPAKVNLIPCNATTSSLKGSPGGRVRIFQEILVEKGIVATMRASRGDGIMAACGQLKNQPTEKEYDRKKHKRETA